MYEYNFVTPKKPIPHNSGYLVIQSDDGKKGDYTSWFPLFMDINRKYNQFLGRNIVPFSPAIITDWVGNSDRMTVEELETIVKFGGEIVSHGTDSHGLLPQTITKIAMVGETSLQVSAGGKLNKHPYEYTLTNGSTTESVVITGMSGNTAFLENPLNNDFAIGSVLEITELSALQELQGAHDAITSWGFECRGHAWPWNENNETMRYYASQVFESARGQKSPPINYPDTTDFYKIGGMNINGLSRTTFDSWLDATVANNGVLWVYGHAERDTPLLENLQYIIEQAITRGIKIVTHSEAVDILKSQL